MSKCFSLSILTPIRAIILIIACSSINFLPLQAAELVDRVVAVVNDEVITMSEVNEEGSAFFKKVTSQAPAAQLEDALRQARENVLDNLIDKRLMEQEALKQHITVSDEEIEAAAQQMLSNNNISKEELSAQLAQMGRSYENYLSTLHSQIIQSKLVNYDIRSKIIITDDMILDYYDTNYTKHVSKGGYYLMQMGFSWNKESTDKTAAKKRAERVRTLVVNGQDFRTLAQKFSDLPSAADGGDLGIFEEDEMASYMRDAVIRLTPGTVSEVVETPSGYQFFKLLSSQDGQIVVQASFGSVKDEIRTKLYDEKLKDEFDNWAQALKENAYIKKL